MKEKKFSRVITFFIPTFLIIQLAVLAVLIIFTITNNINFSKTLIFSLCLSAVYLILLIVFWIMQRHYISSNGKELQEAIKQKDRIIKGTMQTFVNFIDNKDAYTQGHSQRVARYTREMAKRLGFNDEVQKTYYYAGLMHDIGKMTIPDEVLKKSTRLSSEEWGIIQEHTRNGAALLKNFKFMPAVNDAVLYHHERFDGKGYVNMLKGENIPLVARVVCLADSYDAMSTDRVYRIKFSEERIISEFERCAGRQFDPELVPVLLSMIKDGTIYKL